MGDDWQNRVLGDLGETGDGLRVPPHPPEADGARPGHPGPAGHPGHAGHSEHPGHPGHPDQPVRSYGGQAPYGQYPPHQRAAAPTGPQPGASPGAAIAPYAGGGGMLPYSGNAGYGHPPERSHEPPRELYDGRTVHGDPVGRRVGRSIRRVVGGSAGRDVHDATRYAGAIQQAVTTGRRIAVVSIRGGAGKTTVSALLAIAFAHYRRDRVLAVDADPGYGTLAMRLAAKPGISLRELARMGPASATFDQVAPYLSRLDSGLWVLPGTPGKSLAPELELTTYRMASAALGRFFAVSVVDCGGPLIGELTRGILADAHAHVMVVPATVDGVTSAQGALQWMGSAGAGDTLARTVVALVSRAEQAGVDTDRAAAMLGLGGAGVVPVGYDRQLATGSPIDVARLAHDTQYAAIHLAADLLDRAVRR